MQSRRKLDVSFVIRDADEPAHRGGINSIQYEPSKKLLFTAGRDSIIRYWDVSGDKVVHKGNLEHHTDWVNDIALCKKGDNLLSVSSDSAFKVWDVSRRSCSVTIRTHKDYVKAVAFAEKSSTAITGGLDHKVQIWDINQLIAISASNTNVTAQPLSGHRSSVYSVAITPSANIAASGGTEEIVRIWDPRTPGSEKVCKLKGHVGNVRSLALNEDGTQCLSASSDGTVRLWSIGQQRCIMTVRCHRQGVWTLLPDPDNFNHVYSAGRDGSVFLSDVRHADRNELVVQEDASVLKMALDEEKRLWISTTNSCVSLWGVNDSCTEIDDDLATPRCSSPVKTVKGSPAIVQHHVLNDRQHVLTKDSEENVALYNVFLAKKDEELGKVDFEEEIKKRSQVVYVPNWFSLNEKTGLLNITLDEPDCYQAWVHARDAGFPDSEPEVKLNLGGILLRALFDGWVSVDSNQKDGTDKSKTPSKNSISAGSTDSKAQASNDKSAANAVSSQNGPRNGFFSVPQHTPIIISERGDAGSTKQRMLAGQVTPGNEATVGGDTLPVWVRDVVVKNVLPKFSRLAFALMPYKNSAVRPLRKERLSAHDVVRMDKIVEHVFEQLFAGNDPIMPSKDVEAAVGKKPEEVVQILCQDLVLSPEHDLRTVKYFFWKAGGDMQIMYRLKAEAPPPQASNDSTTAPSEET